MAEIHDRADWRNNDHKKFRQAALDAWHAPSWREAAIEYHKDRPLAPRLLPNDKLTPSPRDIWRAARTMYQAQGAT